MAFSMARRINLWPDIWALRIIPECLNSFLGCKSTYQTQVVNNIHSHKLQLLHVRQATTSGVQVSGKLKTHLEMGTDDTTGSLADSIQAKLGTLPTFSPRRCIYRVPEPLRVVKYGAYTPSMVSIGPYHCKDIKLLPMEIHKLKYLKTFLHHSQGNGNLNIYLQFVKDNETLIRECYADPITDLTCNEFIEMILVDAVFLIELFRRTSGICMREEDDFIFKRPRLINCIIPDLSMAENQLPFFVIQGLYKIAFRPDFNGSTAPHLIDIANMFLKLDMNRIQNPFDALDRGGSLHLLDLLRNSYLPSEKREEVIINTGNEDPIGTILCPSITRLREAGIKFQVANDSSKRLLDIHFDKENAVLIIPKIYIADETKLELRNLTAFEQCHYLNQPYICEYLCLMDCLINTSKDVELLVEKGIIKNWLGSDEEVCDLFNNLGTQVTINSKYYYGGLTSQLNARCNKRWNIYKAILKYTYFGHPWAAMSVIYAVVLLILTIIQVVTGILSVPRGTLHHT